MRASFDLDVAVVEVTTGLREKSVERAAARDDRDLDCRDRHIIAAERLEAPAWSLAGACDLPYVSSRLWKTPRASDMFTACPVPAGSSRIDRSHDKVRPYRAFG